MLSLSHGQFSIEYSVAPLMVLVMILELETILHFYIFLSKLLVGMEIDFHSMEP